MKEFLKKWLGTSLVDDCCAVQQVKITGDEELDDHVMTLEEFIGNCEAGGFIDYDGIGYYSKDGKTYLHKDTVVPSEVINGKANKKFSHVVWFNR